MDDFDAQLQKSEKKVAQEILSDQVIDPNPDLYPHKSFEGDYKFFKPIYTTREELNSRNINYLDISRVGGEVDDKKND